MYFIVKNECLCLNINVINKDNEQKYIVTPLKSFNEAGFVNVK